MHTTLCVTGVLVLGAVSASNEVTIAGDTLFANNTARDGFGGERHNPRLGISNMKKLIHKR